MKEPDVTLPTLRVIDQHGNEGREIYQIPHAAPAPPAAPGWAHDPARPTYLHFDRYAAWRRTKCRPVRQGCIEEALRDLDQATHEFVGEVGEMATVILQHGSDCYRPGTEARSKLIDEAGDVFFCGSWLGDAWGRNPILMSGGDHAGEFLLDAQIDEYERLAAAHQEEFAAHRYNPETWQFLNSLAASAAATAGLLCNHFKKLRYQQRRQDTMAVANKIHQILEWAAKSLVLADATVVDALFRNVTKLDHRYPEGYRPNSGGGDRTGVGA